MLSTPQNSSSDEALAAGLAALHERLTDIARSSGRDVRSITLLAVSKGQAVSRLRAALALGLTQFGENYVDEALPKIQALADTLAQWHFIGHLQANKTRAVAFKLLFNASEPRTSDQLNEACAAMVKSVVDKLGARGVEQR
jgi:uncharacterized pyridoxal phosphate-containing UPF0001 family protein